MEDALPQGVPVSGATPGHENTRIGLRGIILFTVVLVASVVVVEVVIGLAMGLFAHEEQQADARHPGRLAIEVDQFPKPRLQKNPADDLAQMKDEEKHRITSYGWVDRKTGIARIPIDRAMAILARSGLPNVAAPAPVPGAPPNTSIPPGTKRDEPRPVAKQVENP